MKIEIVTHCYAEKISFYARALVRQLSSLILQPPDCEVRMVVCYTPSDKKVSHLIDHFFRYDMACLDWLPMPLPGLGRRSIGRNIEALSTDADIIWFTDVDYVFRGCLQDLAQFDWPDNIDIVFPKHTLTSEKTYGDQLSNTYDVVDIDPTQFQAKENHRAIGGVQIVKGDFAREHGYLDSHPEWRQPTKIPFRRDVNDARYRRECRTQRINLPGVYRIQHSEKAYNQK